MGRKSGAVLSSVSLIFEVISSLLVTPFIIRSFGQSEYGVYTLVLAITAYLSFLDLGVGNAVIKFAAKYLAHDDLEGLNRFAGIINVFYCIVAVAIAAIGVVLYKIFPIFFAEGLTAKEILLSRKLLIVSLLNMMVVLGTSGFYNIAVSFENFNLTKGVSLVGMIIRILATIVLLISGYKSFAILVLILVVNVACRGVVVGAVIFKYHIRGTLKGAKISDIKDILSFSLVITLAMIATQINNMSDQVILGSMVHDATRILTIYGVGITIVQYYQSMGNIINGILMPGVVKQVENGATSRELENEMIKFCRLNLIYLGIVWCVFLINGQFFMALWGGEENVQSYYVAVILMFIWMIILPQNIGSLILMALNKHRLQALLKFIAVIVNIFLTVALIKIDPLYGATIGTAISLLVGDVIIMQIMFKKYIGIRLVNLYSGVFKGIVPCLLFSCVIGILVKILPVEGGFQFLINCLLMVVFYLGALFWKGMNSYEKALINAFVFQVKKRGSDKKNAEF